MEKIRVSVKIGGRDYTLTTNDTKEHVERIAELVDRTLNELSLATRLPATDVAVLSAVSIEDELIKAQDEIRKLRAENIELHKKLEHPFE